MLMGVGDALFMGRDKWQEQKVKSITTHSGFLEWNIYSIHNNLLNTHLLQQFFAIFQSKLHQISNFPKFLNQVCDQLQVQGRMFEKQIEW